MKYLNPRIILISFLLLIISLTNGCASKTKPYIKKYNLRGLVHEPKSTCFVGLVSLKKDNNKREDLEVEFTVDDVGELIREKIHPEKWDEEFGSSLIVSDLILEICNTREVHKEIRAYIIKLKNRKKTDLTLPKVND